MHSNQHKAIPTTYWAWKTVLETPLEGSTMVVPGDGCWWVKAPASDHGSDQRTRGHLTELETQGNIARETFWKAVGFDDAVARRV